MASHLNVLLQLTSIFTNLTKNKCSMPIIWDLREVILSTRVLTSAEFFQVFEFSLKLYLYCSLNSI